MSIRYSYGGDEFIFVELDESMSLPAFFKSMALTKLLQEQRLPGITEICPANASYQIRIDPDVLAPEAAMQHLQSLEQQINLEDYSLQTRIIEIPVLYGDPWTHETLMRFRERHQDPSKTDLEYAAQVNDFASVEAFIEAHSQSPWFVSMVGFVAGLPFMYQMVERDKQLEVPKYLRPRTDTPKLTVGHGGCFACIYSVQGAGGYQMFGVTPAPIYEPAQVQPYLKDTMTLFLPGDIVKFKAITRAEYDSAVQQASEGTLSLKIKPVTFQLQKFLAHPEEFNSNLLETFYAD